MQGWLDDPVVKQVDKGKWKALTGYGPGPGLRYGPNDGDISETTTISLSLPAESVAKLANGSAPSEDYWFYLWNGIDFNLSQINDSLPFLNQILQPVLWKGRGSVAVPDNGLYPGYTWIYDDETEETLKSSAWTSENLATFRDLNFPADVNLHYYEDNLWEQVNAKEDLNLFNQKLAEYEIFFNSQYINSVDDFFWSVDNELPAKLFVLSEDIIALPSAGASVSLEIEIPSDGSSITITGTPDIIGVDQSDAPKSILNVDEIYSPLTKQWNQENVFRSVALSQIGNIWESVNDVFPVLGETYAYGGTEAAASQATERMGDLLDGLKIGIELQLEPSFPLTDENTANPVELILLNG